MKGKLLLATAFLTGLVSHTLAGELQTSVTLLGAGTLPSTATVEVKGDAQVIELTPKVGGWQYNWIDTKAALVRLSITVKGVASGSDVSYYEIDLPYYYDRTPLRLASFVIVEEVADRDVAAVVKRLLGGAWMSDPAKLHAYTERMKRIVSKRRPAIIQDSDLMSRDDVIISYWLVVGAREIFERKQIIPGSDVESAVSILSEAIDLRPELFGQKTIKIEVAQQAISRLREWENVKYLRIVNELGQNLQTSNKARFLLACGRANTLWSSIRNLTDDEYVQATSAGAIHIRLATYNALCFSRTHTVGDQLTDDEIVKLNGVLEDLDRLIPSASGQERQNAETEREILRPYLGA